MKKLNIIFALFIGMTTTIRAVNYPNYQPVVHPSYCAHEFHVVGTNPFEGAASSTQAMVNYQPGLNDDGSAVAPTASSGPRRDVVGPSSSPDSRCRFGGEHEFVDGVCTKCGTSHNHYDADGDSECDQCHAACGKYAGTPGANASNMIPLGSAVLPLLLMLLGYAALLHRRRKQEVCE